MVTPGSERVNGLILNLAGKQKNDLTKITFSVSTLALSVRPTTVPTKSMLTLDTQYSQVS